MLVMTDITQDTEEAETTAAATAAGVTEGVIEGGDGGVCWDSTHIIVIIILWA
jgi:hypothetical protein